MATQGKLYSREEATAIIFQGLYDNEASSSDSEISEEEEEEPENVSIQFVDEEDMAFEEFFDFSVNEDLTQGNNVSDQPPLVEQEIVAPVPRKKAIDDVPWAVASTDDHAELEFQFQQYFRQSYMLGYAMQLAMRRLSLF